MEPRIDCVDKVAVPRESDLSADVETSADLVGRELLS